MSTKLILQDVRTFVGLHEIEIRPLTLLVGENSTGKTTFLASFAAAFDTYGFPGRPAFNQPPYDLGSYDTIATYRGGEYGRARQFMLGRQVDHRGSVVRSVATYVNSEGEPVISNFEITNDVTKVSIDFIKNVVSVKSKVVPKRGARKRPINMVRHFDPAQMPPGDLVIGGVHPIVVFLYMIFRRDALVMSRVRDLIYGANLFETFESVGHRTVVSVAPVRTKPRRTYDVLSEAFEPEGEHVPSILAKAFKATGGEYETLRRRLRSFGHEAGLFENLSVKRLGKKPGNPIQILVKGAGRAANLIDVGYGVSQVLPLIVQSSVMSPRSFLLLQQPEVHLHPKAQAAMGTFFVDLVAKEKRRLIVETHSDFIVDRVRQHVGSGTISPKQVALLFFEKHGTETRRHMLELDGRGNIMNPPPGYRRFFMEEEMRTLRPD